VGFKYAKRRMEFERVREIVRRALDLVYDRDRRLFQLGASEWTLAHRFAVYLEWECRGWDVDCEYNRQRTRRARKTNARAAGPTCPSKSCHKSLA
jgi:hypothetical protein